MKLSLWTQTSVVVLFASSAVAQMGYPAPTGPYQPIAPDLVDQGEWAPDPNQFSPFGNYQEPADYGAYAGGEQYPPPPSDYSLPQYQDYPTTSYDQAGYPGNYPQPPGSYYGEPAGDYGNYNGDFSYPQEQYAPSNRWGYPANGNNTQAYHPQATYPSGNWQGYSGYENGYAQPQPGYHYNPYANNTRMPEVYGGNYGYPQQQYRYAYPVTRPVYPQQQPPKAYRYPATPGEGYPPARATPSSSQPVNPYAGYTTPPPWGTGKSAAPPEAQITPPNPWQWAQEPTAVPEGSPLPATTVPGASAPQLQLEVAPAETTVASPMTSPPPIPEENRALSEPQQESQEQPALPSLTNEIRSQAKSTIQGFTVNGQAPVYRPLEQEPPLIQGDNEKVDAQH